MLSITDGGSLARALKLPLDPRLKNLLEQRRDQLGGDITDLAHFLIVEPRDTVAAVFTALGFSPVRNPVDGACYPDPEFTPGWEWIADHGFCFEIVFVMDDSGFGHAIIVPKKEGINPQLMALCTAYAPKVVS